MNTSLSPTPTTYVVEDAAQGSVLLRTRDLAVAIISAHALAFHVGTDMLVCKGNNSLILLEVKPDDVDVDALLLAAGVSFA